MDALSDILKTAPVTGSFFSRAELGAPWGLHTTGTRSAIFHVGLSGGGYVTVEGLEPQPFRGGDVVLMPHGHPHVLSDQPGRSSVAIQSMPRRNAAEDDLPCVVVDGGARTTILCGSFRFSAEAEEFLLPLLPPLMLVRGGESPTAAWLDSTLRWMSTELATGQPGSELLLARLADVLFVQVLRRWWEQERPEAGLLAGLADPAVARALDLIHRRPASPWTAEDLAKKAGLSRTAFFSRFQKTVGETPSAYVARWRMVLARKALRRGAGLCEVSESVGYSSEAAFSRAFKRVVGLSPSVWRQTAANAST